MKNAVLKLVAINSSPLDESSPLLQALSDLSKKTGETLHLVDSSCGSTWEITPNEKEPQSLIEILRQS